MLPPRTGALPSRSTLILSSSKTIARSSAESFIFLSVTTIIFARGCQLKPQLKTLGPKYGKKLGAISSFLSKCNAKEVVNAVKNGGSYEIEGEDVVLKYEDLQISIYAF